MLSPSLMSAAASAAVILVNAIILVYTNLLNLCEISHFVYNDKIRSIKSEFYASYYIIIYVLCLFDGVKIVF